MTGQKAVTVRHIPEEELHAYSDQALSRSQCIEIESHLAMCPACRRDRDAIAALRDRTTRLLAIAAPQRIRAPVWTELQGLAMVRRQRRPWRRTGVWAASIAAAVLAGWGLRALSDPHSVERLAGVDSPRAPAIVANLPQPRSVDAVAVEPLVHRDPTPAYGAEAELQLATARNRSAPPTPPAPEPVAAAPASLALDGQWTAVSLGEAEDATARQVPIIPDLPVQAVWLRRGAGPGRPVVIVSQTHPSGEVVYTIEGPLAGVAEVVAAQLGPTVGLSSSEPSRSTPDYLDSAGGVRRTNRVLAVLGRLSADSLSALAMGVVLR